MLKAHISCIWRSVVSLVFLTISWYLFWIYVHQSQEIIKCLNWSVKYMSWISICNDVVPKSGLWNVIIQKTFQLAYYSAKNQFYRQHSVLKKNQKKLSLCDSGLHMRMKARIMFSFGVYSTGHNADDWVSILTTWRLITYPIFRVCQNRILLCIYLPKSEILTFFL